VRLPSSTIFHGGAPRIPREAARDRRAFRRGPVVPCGCAVASEPASGGLPEESSRLDRLPLQTNDFGVSRRRPWASNDQ
jgi:hypothetical protein